MRLRHLLLLVALLGTLIHIPHSFSPQSILKMAFSDPRDKPFLPGWLDVRSIEVGIEGDSASINLTLYAPPPIPLRFKAWLLIDGDPDRGGLVKEVWPYVSGVDYYAVIDRRGVELMAWTGTSFKPRWKGEALVKGGKILLKLPIYAVKGRLKLKVEFEVLDRYSGSMAQWIALWSGCRLVADPKDMLTGLDLKGIGVRVDKGYLVIKVELYDAIPSPLNPPLTEDYLISVSLPAGFMVIDGDGDGFPDYFLSGFAYVLYRSKGLLGWFMSKLSITDGKGKVLSQGMGAVSERSITYFLPLEGLKIDEAKAKITAVSSALELRVGEAVPNVGWAELRG